jgi:hypothetical protein
MRRRRGPSQIFAKKTVDYRAVSDLAHAADDIVVAEIENWQAVFGGKHVTAPV